MTQPSNWPRARNYQEAIQNPAACFTSPGLRTARIYTNDYGLPVAAAGRSAIVFKANTGSGVVALRCFTRASSDQRLRYQALHNHLGATPPPYMVDFTYHDQEILVPPKRYPLVEMGWVEGDPLDVWVARHLGRGTDLANQARAWLGHMQDMEARKLAHGDIANDNCLISGNELKLVDYDGCFIHGLESNNPGEAGNPHFQHPGRPGYYAGNMDAFPALVVYLSLVALQGDQSLWQQFHADKNLIFIATDYKSPWDTAIWKALATNPDGRVVALTAALASMCRTDVAALPALSAVVDRVGSAGPTPWPVRFDTAGNGAATPGQGSPDWLKEVLQTQETASLGPAHAADLTASPSTPLPPGAPPAPASVPQPTSTPDWLGDYMPGGPASRRDPAHPAGVPPRPVPPTAVPSQPTRPVAPPQPQWPQQIGLPPLPLGTGQASPSRSVARKVALAVIVAMLAVMILVLVIGLAAL